MKTKQSTGVYEKLKLHRNKELQDFVLKILNHKDYKESSFTEMVKDICSKETLSKKQRHILLGHAYHNLNIL